MEQNPDGIKIAGLQGDPDSFGELGRLCRALNMQTRLGPTARVQEPPPRTTPRLRLETEARGGGDTALAAALLEQVQPDSADSTTATVAACAPGK